MSAALLLLPWVAATYARAQLRQWQISADRLSAGVVVGIDYPTPAHVSELCELVMADEDARARLVADHQDATDKLETECAGAVTRLEECETERDEARAQLKTAEANKACAKCEQYKQRIIDLHTQQTKIADALRTLADALKDGHGP